MISSRVVIIDLPGSTSFKSLRNLGYNVIEPYKNKQRIDFRKRFLLHLLWLDNIPFFNSIFDLNSELVKIQNPQIIIIMGSLIYEPFFHKLRNLFPSIPILYSYSNIVSDQASINPSVLKKYKIIGLSWDIDDCSKYGLKYQNPSIEPNLLNNISSDNIFYDVCFIGADKGRRKMVKEIDRIISNAGYRTYIHITPDYRFFRRLHKDYKDKISYNQYLKITSLSNCIIDLVQKGQVGTTMRTMEAIFNRKKLISNNERLKEYDFYNPDNIFIITKDNIKNIPEFLRTPYIPIRDETLKKYILKDNMEKLLQSIIDTND